MKLSDIELDDFSEAIIQTNITHWVRTEVVQRLAEKYIERYGDDIIANVKIDKDELSKKVLHSLAERIIADFVEGER